MVVDHVSLSVLPSSGFFLLNLSLACEIHALVNLNVHLFNQNAVSWNAISLFEIDDISNNNITNWNLLDGSMSSSVNCNNLVVNLILQFQILSLLNPVAEG